MHEDERKILPFVRKGENSEGGNIDNDPRVQRLLKKLQNLKDTLTEREGASWEKQNPESDRHLMNDIDALEEELRALRARLEEKIKESSE